MIWCAYRQLRGDAIRNEYTEIRIPATSHVGGIDSFTSNELKAGLGCLGMPN